MSILPRYVDMPPEKFAWTSSADATLRRMAYGRATVLEIAAACGCSEKTVRNRCFKLRLPLTSRLGETVRGRIKHMQRRVAEHRG